MGTTVTPASEPPLQIQSDPSSQEGQQNQQVDSTSQPTQQTNQPNQQATDDTNKQLLRMYEENQRELNRRLQEQANEIQALKNQKPPADPEKTRADWYNDPEGSTKRAIAEELERTVAPLVSDVRSLLGNRQVEGMLKKFEADPRISVHIQDPAIKQYVTEMMNQQGVTPTEGLVGATVLQAIGLKAANLLPGSTTVPQPPNPPPHHRPTAPNPPRPTSQQVEFSEDERKFMRDRNLTEKQFLALKNAAPTEITTIDLTGEKK